MEQLHLPGMEPENGAEPYNIPPPPEAIKAKAAFLIVITPEGNAVGYSDHNTPLDVERVATFNDMYAACAQVMKDIQIMQTTQSVVQNMVNTQMQIGQQLADQQMAQKILQPNRMQRRM